MGCYLKAARHHRKTYSFALVALLAMAVIGGKLAIAIPAAAPMRLVGKIVLGKLLRSPFAVTFVILLAAACGGSTADFATCQGFLDVAEVEAITDQIGLLSRMEPAPDLAGRLGGLEACLLSFEPPNRGRGIFLQVELFGSAGVAEQRYQQMNPGEDFPGLQTGVVGPDSFVAVGIDPEYVPIILVLRHDRVVVLIQDDSSLAGGEPLEVPVAWVDQYIQLASLVKDRLP